MSASRHPKTPNAIMFCHWPCLSVQHIGRVATAFCCLSTFGVTEEPKRNYAKPLVFSSHVGHRGRLKSPKVFWRLEHPKSPNAIWFCRVSSLSVRDTPRAPTLQHSICLGHPKSPNAIIFWRLGQSLSAILFCHMSCLSATAKHCLLEAFEPFRCPGHLETVGLPRCPIRQQMTTFGLSKRPGRMLSCST